MRDKIKLKLTPQSLNEFNGGKEEFEPLEYSVTKEPFRGKKNYIYICLVQFLSHLEKMLV